jgi:hypothetical protein
MPDLELKDFIQMQIDKEEGVEDNSPDGSQEETTVNDGRSFMEAVDYENEAKIEDFDSEEEDEVDETDETEDDVESDEEGESEEEQPETDSTEEEQTKSIDYENQYKELLPDYTRKSQRVKELEQYADDAQYLLNNPKELKRYLESNNIDLSAFNEKPIEQPKVPEITEFETEAEKLLYQRTKAQEEQISNLSGQLQQMSKSLNKFENYMADENSKNYMSSLRNEFLNKAEAEGISPKKLHIFHAFMEAGTRLAQSRGGTYTADDAIAQMKEDMKIDNPSVEDILAKDEKLNEKLKQKYIDEYITEKEKTRRKTTSLSSMKTSDRKPISKKKVRNIVDVESGLLAAMEDGVI